MSAETSSDLHPVLAAVAVVDDALRDVVDIDPIYMSAQDKGSALLALSSVIDRADELRMRVLASADDLAAEEGARDAAAWLAHHARLDRGEWRRLRLARSLEARETTAAALRRGEINVAQAEVVVRAIDDLPDEIDDAVRTAAEERLVEEAGRFGPRALRVLGRRVVDVVAPEVAEDLERKLLEQEEARAARRTNLSTRRNGDGTTDIRIRVSDLVCDRLLTYLEAFTSPRREPGLPADERQPHGQRLGAAFASFLEAVDPARLPLHGGDATTLLVTVDLEVLRSGLGVGYVGDEPLSAAEARRLSCTASIIPAVLGGASQVLDAGRARRLFSPAQRKALAATQPTCRAVGCDVPAAWCEAHHAAKAWARGGLTDLADGVLLCPFHHHRTHDIHYEHERMSDGRVRFHRRT